MKSLFVLLAAVFLSSAPLNAQDLDTDEGVDFWAWYISPILQYNVDEVIRQSSFPLATYEGDLSEEEFRELFPVIFDETTLETLSYMDHNSIQVLGYDEYTVYRVTIYSEFEIDGEYFETATILSFKQEFGAWKMFRIDIAG